LPVKIREKEQKSEEREFGIQ